jgi:hypothetical protein
VAGIVRALEWVTHDQRRVVAAVLALVLLSGTAATLAVARSGLQAAAAAAPRPRATSTDVPAPAATDVPAPAATEVPPAPATSATDVPAPSTATARASGPAGGIGATPVASRTPGGVTRLITWLQDFAPASGGHFYRRMYVSYHALAAGNCRRVFDTDLEDELRIWLHPALVPAAVAAYHGAAAACLAAFHGRASLWSTAATDLGTASGVPASRLTSRDRAVLDLLRALVQAHQDDADVTLLRPDERGGYEPCPRLLSLSPDHGPVEGGYEVVATGEHLPPTVRIELRGMATVLGRSDASGTRAVFTMPPAGPKWREAADGRTLDVQARDWPLSHSVEFTYEPSGPPVP